MIIHTCFPFFNNQIELINFQQMKFHRPSAVMSDIRNRIFIVERDYIHITEPDGRLIQKIGHPSIRQLYGLF